MTLETFTDNDERVRSWLGLDTYSKQEETRAMTNTQSNGLGLQGVHYTDYLTGNTAHQIGEQEYVITDSWGRLVRVTTLATLLAQGFVSTPDTDEEWIA